MSHEIVQVRARAEETRRLRALTRGFVRPGVAVLVLALVHGAVAACHTYRPGRAPTPERLVRVVFERPEALGVSVAGGDTVWLENVSRVDGRVMSVRRDTLRLAVRSVRADPPPPTSVRGGVAELPMAAGRTIQVRERAEGRTFLAVLFGSAAFVFLFALFSYLAEPGYGL